MTCRVLSWGWLLGWWLLAAPAAAQERSAEEQAKAHFEAGRNLYDSGEFLNAAHEFQMSHDISLRPSLLYNIYLAYRDANEPKPAADALRRYLQEEQDIPNRQQLVARLRVLEAAIAEEDKPTPAAEAAPVAVEPAVPPPAPEPAPIAAEASAEVRVDESSAGSLSVLPLVLIGSGGALIAGGVVTGLMSASALGELEDNCSVDAPCPSRYEATRDRGQILAVATDALIVAGVAAAATGVVLWILDDGEDEAPIAGAVCLPGSCRVALRYRF